ncbi:hypothetical protein F4809DRAFT_349235 [Biscogniauxia mediterranea]|nr:hypothetical protein F4809DRAFT_349235 [Biscogniauxia mediterranea]
MTHGQIDQPKASGKTTPIAETEETRKQVTELEESKSQEDSTSNETAATPTEPEKGTVMVSPSEQLTIGTSKAEGPDETTKVEDPVTHEEQEDAIEPQEPVEEAVLPEEDSGAGEQAPSADTKDGALSEVVETATPEAKVTKVKSPGSKDAVIEPEQPKEIASAEVTKPGEESSSQRAENSSVILKATTATEPEVVNESEVPKEVSEPAAVAEPVPSEPSEQTNKAVMTDIVEGTVLEVEKERNELLADKEKSSAASNVQEEPQIAKDVADSTDYELSPSDSKTGTEEKEGSPQSVTVKENPDSAEPIVEVKEASSNAAPSQDVTASDSRVETLGETAPAAILEAPTDCPSPKHTEDPLQGLSTKELIERKIRMHQMQEDNECKDTIGPILREEIAARRTSKGEDQSVPSCVRDTPDVIANDFGEGTPELVLENVSSEEGLEGEGRSDEGEPGDKSTAGVQETALRQPDDSQSPVIPQVRENKSTGPKINTEDSQHLLEEVSQEAVEGHPAKDTTGETHQLALPGEDPTEPAHDLVKDAPEIPESDRGPSQELAHELQSQPKEIMTTDTSEGVTPGGSSAETQGEPNISETAERLIMQDKQPEQDPDNSRESSDHGIATSGDSTQTSIENSPIESKASENYAASSSKHRQEDPVVNEEGQPGPIPTETLIEDPPSDPKVEQEPPETQLSTQSHSSGVGLEFGSLADVAQTEIETKTTSTFPTEVNSTAGQNEDVADVAQQLSPSPNNTSQQDSFQREMNQDSCTENELNLEASDNTIDTDGISEIVAEPEQIAPVAIHSSEQSVKDTSHLSIINENASIQGEVTDTKETTSIQEENEAAVSRPFEDESEEQIHDRTKESVNDEPVPSSGTQDPERAITSSSDGVDGQALGSISSQNSANNKGPSDVEEPTVEAPEIVEGESSEDLDEHIQESTPPPPTDHIEELTTQNSESTESPSDQGIVEMPAQEPVGVRLAKNPGVKASAPEETVSQVPDEATKDRLVESREDLPPSVEKVEEFRSVQLEEQAPQQPSSDEELISTQKSTSIEESNVIEETLSVKGETVGKVEGESNMELPTVTNDTGAGGQLHPSNSSESGAVVSSSADSDNEFILVERLDKDVLNEPIFKTQEPEAVTLGSVGEVLPPTKGKHDTPLHFPVKEATPGTRGSEKTHIDKEGQTESEVNELVTGSVTDENDLAAHKTPEDLSIPALESVVVLENSVKHDPETPESPVIIDKAHPATDSDNGESSVSTSGSHVIIERETDQSEDRGDILGKAVQGHKEPDQTMISDTEQTQPLVQNPQSEKLNSEVGSEELQVLGEVPVKPVGMRQIGASDKDHGNDSDSGDEARVDVIGSEVAGAAIIAAGSAMPALKSSAISEPARPPSIIQTVVSKDDVERGEGSSLGKIPLESAAESTPGVKNGNVSAETPKATEKSEEVRDSSSQETSKDTEVVHTSPQFNSSDDSQSTQKKLSSTDNAVITESIAEKTNQQLRPAIAESPELVASNTPLSEPFTVIDARPMKTKRSRHAFFPDLVHSGTQTDEDLDFASLWDRNLQCFFDLANMEPRSTTPGIVLPDLSDSKTKTLGRARSVKKQRRQSYKRAEATIAAAVIIYAASQQLDPSKKEMLEGHQAKEDDGKELETSQEPTQEPHDISSGVAKMSLLDHTIVTGIIDIDIIVIIIQHSQETAIIVTNITITTVVIGATGQVTRLSSRTLIIPCQESGKANILLIVHVAIQVEDTEPQRSKLPMKSVRQSDRLANLANLTK